MQIRKPRNDHFCFYLKSSSFSVTFDLHFFALFDFVTLQKWSITQCSVFLFINTTFPEKAMAPHSTTLVWEVPWMEEPGRLQSMGLLRVRHDWATSLSLFTFMHWRRKWQPTPVFLPGESQGWESLMGCRLWGLTELDTTQETWQQQHYIYRKQP